MALIDAAIVWVVTGRVAKVLKQGLMPGVMFEKYEALKRTETGSWRKRRATTAATMLDRNVMRGQALVYRANRTLPVQSSM